MNNLQAFAHPLHSNAHQNPTRVEVRHAPVYQTLHVINKKELSNSNEDGKKSESEIALKTLLENAVKIALKIGETVRKTMWKPKQNVHPDVPESFRIVEHNIVPIYWV